ncbi:CENPH protein, partial [Aegithalos caudatus]|nr:CENPH protein [Aegithalos caudatus]
LERKIEEEKVSFQNKTLALQRMQIMDALRKKLEENDKDSRLILETMKEIGLLSRTIIKYQQQTYQKEEQVTDMKRKRLSLKADIRQKVQQIVIIREREKEKQASVDATEAEIARNKLEQERKLTTVIQQVFQNLVIGSRVNWAEDPSLKKVVLQLEENIYLQ